MTPEREELAKRVEITLKEYIDSKVESVENSIVAAKVELDRRLHALNELHKQVLTDRGQYLRTERFEGILEEWNSWRNRLDNRITVIETRSITWTSIFGIFFTVMQIAASLFLYFLLHK